MGEAGEVNKLLLGVGHYPAILPDNEAILTGRSLLNELNFIYTFQGVRKILPHHLRCTSMYSFLLIPTVMRERVCVLRRYFTSVHINAYITFRV